MIPWLAARFVGRRAVGELSRLALLVMGVGLGVSLFVAILYAAEASVAAFERGIGRFDGAGRLEIRPEGTHVEEADLEPLARSLALDYRIFPFLVVKAIAKDPAGKPLPVNLIGSHAVMGGREEPAPGKGSLPIVLPPPLAGRLGASEGSVLAVEIGGRALRFTVSGVTEPEELPLPADSAITDLGLLQRETGMWGKLSYLGLLPLGGDEGERRASALGETLRGRPLRLVGDAERRLAADSLSRAFRSNVLVLVALTLVVAGFTVFNSTRMSMLNVAREISILRTLGLDRGRCVLLLLCEALAIGVLGSALGLTLGRPVTDLAARLFLETVSGLYGTGRGFEALGVGAHWHLYAVASAAGISACLLGAIAPALAVAESPGLSTRTRAGIGRAAPRLRDAVLALSASAAAVAACLAALSYGQVAFAYLGAVAILLALVFASPLVTWVSVLPLRGLLARVFGAPGLVAVANVSASLGSSSLAVAGNAIALSLLVAMGLMIGSFRETLADWVDHTFAADLFLKPAASGSDVPGVIPEGVYDAIARLPQVRAVSRYVSFESSVSGQPVTVAGADLAPEEASGVYRLIEGRLDPDELRTGEAVLISETASAKLGKRAGNRVTVAGRSVLVSGVFKDFSRERPTLLFSIVPFRELFPVSGYHTLSIRLHGGSAEPGEVRAIADDLGLVLTSNAEIRRIVFRIFEKTFGVTRLMAIVVAVICAFGFLVSLGQGVWERRADIKTLVYMGASGRDINRSLVLEALLLSLPSAVLGLAGGFALACILVYLVNPLSFGWTLTPSISPIELAIPLALILGANAIVGSAALWRLGRIVAEARVSYE